MVQNRKTKYRDLTYIQNDHILTVHWNDKKDVFVLSLSHGNFSKFFERYSGNVVNPECISKHKQHIERR